MHLSELRGNGVRGTSSHTTRVGLLRASQRRQTIRVSTTMMGTSSLRSQRPNNLAGHQQQHKQSVPLFPQLEAALAETRFTVRPEWKHSYRERRRQEQLD